jgi:exodeoxyribonuclease-3
MTIKISTWNVNSINARLEHLLNWLKEEKPDIALLQELKCLTEAFPYQQIEDLGYNIAAHGQKSYNGVAILSKFPLSDISTDFPDNPINQEARYIEGLVNFPQSAIRVASVYVPNGQSLDSDKYQNKLKFLQALKSYYQTLISFEEPTIIGGDFNIALTNADIYDPEIMKDSILFSPEERQYLRNFISTGLTDIYRILNHTEEGYTWWDYRANSFMRNHGARIDYIFCSAEAAHLSKECFISKEWRSKPTPSDHIPLSAIFRLG